jgi:AcrR family transcriptional regulator
MAERRPRGRRNDPEGMRNRVLDAAADMFQARGYHASAMHELARAAGVTSGALHHHFATKKALGLAVIRERVAEAVREAWLQPVLDAETVADGVAQACGAIASGLEDQGAVRGCPLNNLVLELGFGDPAFRAELADVFAEWRAVLAERFEDEGRSAGAADALATFVIAAYSGAMSMAKAEQSSRPLRICAGALDGLLG